MSTALRASTISTYLGAKSSITEVERSVRKAGTGRNKASFSRGYEVKSWVDGKVRVDYTLGSSRGGGPLYQATAKRAGLDALLKVLLWDYQVEDHKSYLVVTEKKAVYVPELRSQTVSALLGKASQETDIKRSEYFTTRVKGWGHWTTGYEVKKTYAGIMVDFTWGSSHRHDDGDHTRRIAKLTKLAEVLSAKYTVTWTKRGMDRDVLIVTAK
jgi:hypothetical protein